MTVKRARSPTLAGPGAWLALVMLCGCAGATGSPEERVRAVIETAQTAAVKQDLGAVIGFVSERYTDDEGRDRSAIIQLLRGHFLSVSSIHLVTRVQGITFPEPGIAEVEMTVAMAGGGTSTGAIEGTRATLYKFDLTLSEEGHGDWKVSSVGWRRVTTHDFL